MHWKETMTTESTLELKADAALTDTLIAFRREMHADPETGLQLPRTQSRVLEALKNLDLEIVLGSSTTSIVAILRGGAVPPGVVDRPTVLLRGDMDALPITEKSGVDFASSNGTMHACGHDLHTAGLIGAAILLNSVSEQLSGDVMFMFQPGEEVFSGAQAMLDEGLLQLAGSRPLAAYGVHTASDAPAGLFTTRPGPYMAAFGQLDVTVQGRGGHGSRPFQALDPIQVAAEMVGALQTYITRRFNVFDPVVLTVGEFHGGSAANIIPDEATFKAGIRCFSSESEVRLGRELPNLIEAIARAHQLTANAVFDLKLPVTENTPSEAEFWAATATDLFGADRFATLQFPKAGSEDFSKILLEVPGSFGHIGAGSPDIDPAEWAPLHSSRAQFDDRILGDQASFLAMLAVRRLLQFAPPYA